MHKLLLAVLLAAPLTLLAGCDTAGPAALSGPPADARPDRGFVTERHDALTGEVTTGRQDRLPICHYDAETGSYERIEVAAPALAAHLRHGDGSPEGEVPGSEGAAFSEACEVVDAAPFTCTAVEGVDGEGRITLAITLLVTDPDYLPVTGGATVGHNAEHMGYEWIEADGVRAGRSSTFRQAAPTAVSSATIGLGGPHIPGAFVCGPYEFGAPSGV